MANSANNQAIAGYAEMEVSGRRLLRFQQDQASVNLAGVTDVTTLATAVNAAIQKRGAGNTQAATAFKNAGIVAGVHSGTLGTAQQLSFTSSSSCFPGGKRATRWPMRCWAISASVRRAPTVSTTTVGAATAATTLTAFTPAGVTVRISGGGLSSVAGHHVRFRLDHGRYGVSIDLPKARLTLMRGSEGGRASRLSEAAGGALTFTSARGEKLNVLWATGDTANVLGLGTSLEGAGNAVGLHHR